jgi:polar amino acid transport system substrate-binding protein
MRNNKLVLMVIFSLLIMLLTIGSISALAAEKKVYINGFGGDFPPFAYMDEKGNPTGFDIECLNWIAQEMGFEVKSQASDWDAMISTLLAKKIDMIYAGTSITPERLEKVDFTMPYWAVSSAICVGKDSDLNIIAALSGSKHTVGSQRGSVVAEWIDVNLVQTGILPKDNLKLYVSFSLAIQDLLNGRIDSVVMDDAVGEDAIRKGQPVKIIGIINTGEEYGIAVRKEDKELKALLNEGMVRLKKSAKWNELLAKYFSG